jgi:hypothetical protein
MASTGLIKPIRGVVVGSSGQTIKATCIDDDGVAQDVSSFTGAGSGITAVAISPDRRKTATATCSFTTPPGDGSTGLVQWSWAIGDIDRPGPWEIQLEFYKAGTEMTKSYVGTMEVGKALRLSVST